jgi:hypothetical protein
MLTLSLQRLFKGYREHLPVNCFSIIPSNVLCQPFRTRYLLIATRESRTGGGPLTVRPLVCACRTRPAGQAGEHSPPTQQPRPSCF